MTDRFTKAIEQLGKTDGDTPNIEIRLGAIYALGRIAEDSPRGHWKIMEILTAYVRQNAPLALDHAYTEEEKPRTDIQAILTVLGRRKTGPKREERRPGQYLDLMRCRLCGAKLIDANFEGADLEGANLEGAILWNVRLQGAALMETNLEEAYLRGARLDSAFFREAKLTRANLDDAKFVNACDLETQQIQSAKNWHLAHYSPDFRAKLGLSPNTMKT